MQSISSKRRWYKKAISAGFDRYYNYFMSQTLLSYWAGTVPPWCRVYSPSGGVFEINGFYYHLDTAASPREANSGDTVKISFLFCASDLHCWYDSEWDWYARDSVDFMVGLGKRFSEVDSVSLHAAVYGDFSCNGWYEYSQVYPGEFAGYSYVGFFKDMHWHLVELEQVIPTPFSGLDRWNISLNVNQQHSFGPASNSVIWLDQFSVFHNNELIWELNFDPEPPLDPPIWPGHHQIIKANVLPWLRWSRKAPACIGADYLG